MKRFLLIGSFVLALFAIAILPRDRGVAVLAQDAKVASVPAEKAVPSYKKDIRPFSQKYCYECHSSAKAKPSAGLSFDKYGDDDAVQRDRKMWEEVAAKIKSGEMPPEEKPRPPHDSVVAAVSDIEA